MLITIRIPKGSGIKQKIRNTYNELYDKHRRRYPHSTYTRRQMLANIRQTLSINGYQIEETKIRSYSRYNDWNTKGWLELPFKTWYFAIMLVRDKKGRIIGLIQDANYNAYHHNDGEDDPVYLEENKNIKNSLFAVLEFQKRLNKIK